MSIIENYSPNICWGKQHVEIVLKQWVYSASFVIPVGGNCTGFDVMTTALDDLYDSLVSDEDHANIKLQDTNKNVLVCADEMYGGVEWLKKMVVSITIIKWDAPSINDYRKKYNRPLLPRPEGDQLYDPK